MITQTQYIAKTKRMEVLLDKHSLKGGLTKKEQKELSLISDEIASHEETYFPFKADTLIELIELRMYQRKLKQKDLAKMLDISPSGISEFLNGKRKLSLKLAKGLYHQLNIDADLLLNEL